MSREIRVTIDDDEVFERMRARKRDLDVSWREVLHRGLWAGGGPGPEGPGSRGPGDPAGPTGYGPVDDEFGERLERNIRRRVQESLKNALGADAMDDRRPDDRAETGGRSRGDYESEVAELENAEDAVLRFPFLDGGDRERYQVPLRVNLETGADGLDVEVVTVRQGRSVEGKNEFDREARMGIAQGFSRGALALLELGGGVEQYRVAPELTWSRDDDGTPTVTAVDVEDVVFDDRE